MVQFTNIQEQRRPSFGQRVMGAVGSMSQAQQEQAQQAALSQKLNQLTGMDISGLPPELQKVALGEALKSQGKERLLGQKQGMLNELYGSSQQNQQRNMGKDLMGEESQDQQQGGFQAKNITDEQIARHALIDPEGARIMQHEKDVGLREAREEIKRKEKKEASALKSKEAREAEARKETLPIKQKIIEQADNARESIRGKSNLIDLIDRGNMDDPTVAIFLENLPLGIGKRLLSDDTVEYKGGLVDQFKDLKNTFSGATRVKEVEVYENKIAETYLTDSQKKAILKSRINADKIYLIREEAAAEVEEKFPNLGALQFNKKVDELAKAKTDALFNSVWDEQKSIIDQAEHKKKLPLDLNDPDDVQIIDQLLNEAGGDFKKAEKLAKQKGYRFE